MVRKTTALHTCGDAIDMNVVYGAAAVTLDELSNRDVSKAVLGTMLTPDRPSASRQHAHGSTLSHARTAMQFIPSSDCDCIHAIRSDRLD